uniref:TSA: Wollemia nobilis Ref_Wollemi_Transcript_28508_1505 transcribed RNA sequence n=1 Tax=Wollemia nobilis TaxID=56998 RepID=A0A0C9S0X4_9CONI
MMEGKLLKPISFKYGSSTTAPSSPGRRSCSNMCDDFYFSEPTSPTHFLKADHLRASTPISSYDVRSRAVPFAWDKISDDSAKAAATAAENADRSFSTSSYVDHSFEFAFSSRYSEADADPVSAEELFVNGQIRPLNQQQPKSLRSNGRSQWPPRPSRSPWVNPHQDNQFIKKEDDSSDSSAFPAPKVRTSLRNFLRDEGGNNTSIGQSEDKFFRIHEGIKEGKSKDSRTSFRGLSKRWSLKDFLYRSSSEGKDRLWGLPLVPPAKQAQKHVMTKKKNNNNLGKPVEAKHSSMRYNEREIVGKSVQLPRIESGSGKGGRRGVTVSAQELPYNKAHASQVEESKKKTFLPYRRGLLGCLGFTSNSFTNLSGLSPTLHPFS